MTSATIESLEELLRALGKQRSLRGRLRVLGHSWQLLRSLSPADREKVALRVGSSWAWKRLEKSFLADGELSETERSVGRIFERMGDADPSELRRLASSIRRGDRKAGEDLLLMTLTEALEEEAEDEAAREAESPAAEPTTRDTDPIEAPETAAVEREVATEPHLREAPAPVAPARQRGVSEAAPRPSRPAAALPPSRRTPAPPPPFESPPAGLDTNQPEAAESFEDFGAPPTSTGVERLGILRSLQRDQRPGADLGRAGRARLLASLGGGWATRRALSRMIEQHSLDDLDEALDLVAGLGRSGQRIWCLSDLIAHWTLDDVAEQRVLEAAPTAAAQRRLANRLS